MEKRYGRRELFGGIETFLAGSLVFLAFPLNALASIQKLPKRYLYQIPNKVDDLYNDSKHTLLARMLFGEGRSVSSAEKVVIGFTPYNRARDNKSYTGTTIKEAILKSTPKEITDKDGEKKIVLFHKYSCFNLSKKNLQNLLAVYDPIRYDKKQWIKCVDLSLNLLAGKYNKWNFGPTHYHTKDTEPVPKWAKVMKRLDSTGFVHQFYRG